MVAAALRTVFLVGITHLPAIMLAVQRRLIRGRIPTHHPPEIRPPRCLIPFFGPSIAAFLGIGLVPSYPLLQIARSGRITPRIRAVYYVDTKSSLVLGFRKTCPWSRSCPYPCSKSIPSFNTGRFSSADPHWPFRGNTCMQTASAVKWMGNLNMECPSLLHVQ